MDESIEISNEIDVKVLDYFRTEFATNFLIFINIITAIISFYLHLYDFSLHLVVVITKIVHELDNLLFLLLQSLVDPFPHP